MASNLPMHRTGTAAAIGRRASARARVRLPAIVETIDGPRQAEVRNLSSDGAMIEAVRAPTVGRDLVLKCFGIDAFGTVIWEKDDQCGIEFYEPIGDGEVVRKRALSDDEFEQQKWRSRQEMLQAAERWSSGGKS